VTRSGRSEPFSKTMAFLPATVPGLCPFFGLSACRWGRADDSRENQADCSSRRLNIRTAGCTLILRPMPPATSNLHQKHCVRFRWLKVMVRYAIYKYRLRMRGVSVGRPRGDSDGSSGRFRLGKPVRVGPISPHHLVGAKDFPPSDKTHSHQKD
jgi:hypothetical protein